MDANLIAGVPAEVIAAVARVSLSTARRYKRSGRLSATARALLELLVHGELGALAPAWRGFILRGNQLWTPQGLLELKTPAQWELFKRAVA